MEKWWKDEADRLERSGYLPTMRMLAQRLCAPFWWHGQDDEGSYRIFQNGTICFVHTGCKLIGVTADHVYQGYLKDKEKYGVFDCQFGASTVVPEKYLIDRNKELDLATFDISAVLVASSGSSIHYSLKWPPDPVREKEVVLFGGFPGILRKPKMVTADFAFQTFVTAVTEVSQDKISLQFDKSNIHWPLHEHGQLNSALGGQSGGPVFRVVEGAPIDRLELIGFIYEYSEEYNIMLARHASIINGDGKIIRK
jgi:hypothetical protein